MTIPEMHSRLFAPDEQAIIRLDDLRAMREVFGRGAQANDDPQIQHAIHNGTAYDAHAATAHSSSARAFMTGDHGLHHVAADHHDLAAKAADTAGSDYPAGHPVNKDYKSASMFHKACSAAHGRACAVASRGGATGGMGNLPGGPSM
jgi:hypothetical protein